MSHLSTGPSWCQRSSLCEVITEVEEDGGDEEVSVQSQLLELVVFIRDVVFTERPAHVQTSSFMFPDVAAGVRVVA